MKNLNIFFIVLIFSLNYSTEKDTLRWAFEIFRHGARTPYSGMDETFHDCFGHQWIGLKELTGVGLRQHFLVGYRNKLKYTKDYKLINERLFLPGIDKCDGFFYAVMKKI